MKQVLAVLLAIVLVLGLVGCGSSIKGGYRYRESEDVVYNMILDDDTVSISKLVAVPYPDSLSGKLMMVDDKITHKVEYKDGCIYVEGLPYKYEIDKNTKGLRFELAFCNISKTWEPQ